MYKITCTAKGGASYLIVLRPILTPHDHFMVDTVADWSPEHKELNDEIEKLIQAGEIPVIQNYGHNVLAAFSAKQIDQAWVRAKELKSSHSGPEFRLDTLKCLSRIEPGSWWWEKKFST